MNLNNVVIQIKKNETSLERVFYRIIILFAEVLNALDNVMV